MPNHQAGEQARWNPALYDAKHSFVWEFGADVLALLAPQVGERILDLGCGTGHLTAQIAKSGAHVKGIDNSEEMIREARRNYPGLDFMLADAENFQFDEPFDAVFSNAALHWMLRPERVIECIARALRENGRFVAEFGGKGNVRRVSVALLRARAELGLPLPESALPWYYPRLAEYASLLEAHGLEVTFASLFDRPTMLEGGEAGMENWIRMFGTSFTNGLPAEKLQGLFRSVERQLRDEFFRDGAWYVDYRRLRVMAWRRSE